MGFKMTTTIFLGLLPVFSFIVLCSSQEMTYFATSLDKPQGDTEPETTVEDVVVVEAEEFSNQTTAVAKIYEIPNLSDEKTAKSTKVSCLNISNDMTVEVFNTTGLMNWLYINPDVKKRSTPSNCTIVMFFAHWCPFSAKAAPHFNALPRVFPSLKVAAIDATVHSSVNTYFGILSVPTVMLFHNGKLVAKYNETVASLTKFADFITATTDLEATEKLNVTSHDFDGPLPSSQTHDRDLYLYLSWIFIITCFSNYIRKSVLFKSIVEFIRVTWREAEDQHEHQE